MRRQGVGRGMASLRDILRYTLRIMNNNDKKNKNTWTHVLVTSTVKLTRFNVVRSKTKVAEIDLSTIFAYSSVPLSAAAVSQASLGHLPPSHAHPQCHGGSHSDITRASAGLAQTLPPPASRNPSSPSRFRAPLRSMHQHHHRYEFVACTSADIQIAMQ